MRCWSLVLALLILPACATSTMRKDFAVRMLESSAPLPRDGVVDVIEKIAKARGMKKRDANPPHWAGAYSGHGIFLTYSYPSKNEVAVGIQGEARKGEAALRNAIQQSLDLRFKGLQYVELTHTQ